MKPLLALLPLLCVVLTGGTAPWSQGVMLVVVGAVLAAAPPRRSLGWRIDGIALALWALSLTAFLPAGWFHLPAWRAALVDDFGTPLPGSLSPQPWLSVDEIVVFALGLSWFYLVAAADWKTEERLRAGRMYAGGVAVLAAVFVAANRLHLNVPIWHATRDFGPFPNRNQTADFLAAGAVPALACARMAWRARRFPAAAGWLVVWLVTAVGIFHNYSRAGIGLLFVGTAVYLAYEILRQRGGGGAQASSGGARRGRMLAVGASLVLLLASAFFVLGGDTLARMRGEVAAASLEGMSSEFRLRIQHDALDLIHASPWCGVGLGNFTAVFALFRVRSAIPARAVHPESDWLWMVGELGWVSLALLLAGLWLLARRMWPPRRGPDRALRAAAVVAVGLVTLHAFVDVSAHRLGTAMGALFLAGLALPGPAETRAVGAVRSGPGWRATMFRLGGLAFVVLGVCWIQAARGRWDFPGSARAEALTTLARSQAQVRDFADSEAAASQALAIAPLDWSLYFLRATVRVYRQDDAGALADFRRARYLEPLYGTVPYVEATMWASFREPDHAASALLEACRREPAQIPNFVGGVYAAAGADPRLGERVTAAARGLPALELEVLSQTRPPASVAPIAEAVRANPELRGYTAPQRQRFLALWSERGDAAAFVAAMERHPDWQALAWRPWAAAVHGLGNLPAACAIMAAHAPPPAMPPAEVGGPRPSRAELEAAVTANPADPLAALRLSRARKADGDLPGALAALEGIAARRDAPAYFQYLVAVTAGEAGEWTRAWEGWTRYEEAPAQGS